MPQRFAHVAEKLGIWFLALWEPSVFYIGAAIAASMSALHAPPVVGGLPADWAALAGYGVGVAVDLAARGRAYAKIPDDQRHSRLREWKERLTWGAIGLGVGWTLSIALNGWVFVSQPGVAVYVYPLSNMLCVIVAVPLIDVVRGVTRLLGGKSAQEAFAGLVIDWASRKAGKRDE
jgi:hypothetical protein